MKFTIITHALHKIKNRQTYAYEPYVKEMNLWLKFVDEVKIVAPLVQKNRTKIEDYYKHSSMELSSIPSFDLLSVKHFLKSFMVMPIIFIKIYKAMQWADHIHLRCPGNIGLLGCLVQIAFPSKPKTVKYAGNWDPESKQPWSYKLQKWIVSTPLLTRNAKVLVYGEWPNQTKNIIPFFTATYSEKEITTIKKVTDFTTTIHFLFVGTLSHGKRPLLSVQIAHKLLQKGYKVKLHIYGEGNEKPKIENYINNHNLQENIILYGNVDKEEIKEAYKKNQFLLFFSKSEGWPKVVAEAMFWGCLPITSDVSCIPYMLDNGNRGAMVSSNIDEIISVIEKYLTTEELYKKHSENAMKWSQHYTIEKFEEEIKKLLIS